MSLAFAVGSSPYRAFPSMALVLLSVLFGACDEPPASIRIVPPSGTRQVELIILRGACPAQNTLVQGNTVCTRAMDLIYREVAQDGRTLAMPGPIEGPHAVIAVASNECQAQYACVDASGPMDIVLAQSAFRAGTGCGGARECSEQVCAFVACSSEPDAGPPDAGRDGFVPPRFDAGPPDTDPPRLDVGSPDTNPTNFVLGGDDPDDDGLSNCIECAAEGDPCEAMTRILVATCAGFDGDGDSEADYVDLDSDGDGYLDAWECPLQNGASLEACDHDRNGQLDQRQVNRDDDYDADGIANGIDCGGEDLRTCPDDDGDGLVNYRDTNSDNDVWTDAMECPQSPCIQNGAEGSLPNFRVPAPECGCLDVGFSCELSIESICFQTDIAPVSNTLKVTWTRPSGVELGTPRNGPNFLGNLNASPAESPPGAAWRCADPMVPCIDAGAAVGIVETDDGTDLGYFYVDMRDPRVAGEIPELMMTSPRVGRFLYGPTPAGTLGIVAEVIEP